MQSIFFLRLLIKFYSGGYISFKVYDFYSFLSGGCAFAFAGFLRGPYMFACLICFPGCHLLTSRNSFWLCYLPNWSEFFLFPFSVYLYTTLTIPLNFIWSPVWWIEMLGSAVQESVGEIRPWAAKELGVQIQSVVAATTVPGLFLFQTVCLHIRKLCLCGRVSLGVMLERETSGMTATF